MSQSKPSERLVKIRGELDLMLEKRNEGTPDYPRRVAKVDTAMQRALDRAGGGTVPTGDPDLTDDTQAITDSEAKDERRNQERVKRQAEKDAWAISTIVARMVKDAADLLDVVNRQANIVHPGKQEADGALPGCSYCARKETNGDQTIGGHFEGVTDKAPKSGLCRQCRDFKNATGGPPPVMWCHLRHTKGMAHANRWLAKEFPNLKESVDRKAKHKTSLAAEDLELRVEDLVVSQAGGTVRA